MHTMNDTPSGVGWGGGLKAGRQTSTAEENRRKLLNLVEAGLEKIGFQGCFERGCKVGCDGSHKEASSTALDIDLNRIFREIGHARL